MASDEDAALGCLLGAAVGDAAGATLEFKRVVTEADVDEALRMPGGGVLDVGPGQVRRGLGREGAGRPGSGRAGRGS